MTYFLFGLIAANLVFIAYHDFKYRAVWWLLFPVCFIFCLFKSLGSILVIELIKNFALNCAFFIFQIGIVYGYFKIKKGNYIKTFRNAIGIGDLLFFLILCINFSLVNLILFQLISLFGILLVYSILKILKIAKNKFIPLAGGLAIALLIALILQDIFKIIDLYNYSWLSKIIV